MRRELVTCVFFFMTGIASGLAGYRTLILLAGIGVLLRRSIITNEEKKLVTLLIIMLLAGALRITISETLLYNEEMEKHIGLPYTCYGYIKDI